MAITDQREQWRKAIAAHNKAKRNQRSRRKPPQYQPGMNITTPARTGPRQMTSPQNDEGRPRQEDGPSTKIDMPTLARALEHRDYRAYYTRAELEHEFGQPYTVLRELHARWLDRLWP